MDAWISVGEKTIRPSDTIASAGDIAIVKRHPDELKKGDIIVALENGESALKHCHGYANDRLSFSDGASGMIRECPLKEIPLRGIVVGVQRSL